MQCLLDSVSDNSIVRIHIATPTERFTIVLSTQSYINTSSILHTILNCLISIFTLFTKYSTVPNWYSSSASSRGVLPIYMHNKTTEY